MYTIDFFKAELKLIKDPVLRFVTKKVLEAAPLWYWTAPASSSGKYHPPDSNGEGGLVRHTIKAVWIGHKLAECYDIDSDPIVSALILHDWCKFGIEAEMELGKDRPYYKRHGEFAADILQRRFGEFSTEADQLHADELRNKWDCVCACIRSHMGRWGSCPPYTLEQQIVHNADVISSLKELVAVKFYDSNRPVEAPQSNHQRLTHKNGAIYLNFGKYRDKSIKSILDNYPGYAEWILSDAYDKEDVKEAFIQAMSDDGELAANSGTMPEF